MHGKHGEIAILTASSTVIKTLDDVEVDRDAEELTFELEEIEKDGFAHFMLKEIHEQPATIEDSMRGRLLEDQGTAVLGGLSHVTPTVQSGLVTTTEDGLLRGYSGRRPRHHWP